MSNKRLVVVGAGIAGPTAAYFLKTAGYNPIVLEKSEQVGGRMTTDVVNGFTIDYGAQFLMDKFPLLTNLVDRLGLNKELIETSQDVGVVRNGKIRTFTRADPLSALKTGILSLSGCLRFAFLSYRLAAKTKSLPLNDFSAWTVFDDMDAETWSNSYFGGEITDNVIEPPHNVFYLQTPRDTSRVLPMVTTMMLFLEKAHYMTLTGGIGVLPKRLASELDVRLNTPVNSMSVEKTGIELNTDNERVIADRVILASTAAVSKSLYKDPSPVERKLLDTQYSPTLAIAIAVKDSFRVAREISQVYGIAIPRKERNVVVAIANDGNKDRRRLATGELLMAVLSDQAGSEMIDWKDDDILEVVLEEMERYFAGVSDHILFTKIYRWQEAVPESPPGRSRTVAQYRQSVDGSTKVFLAGDYAGMPFTEGAAESGKWAAEALMKNLAA
jgi:oxygen-dependent protoporphyrinogen oxidase